MGLFSNSIIKKDTIIGYYKGTYINNIKNVKNIRYIIQISNNKYLDCYEAYKNKKCLLSYVNSATNSKFKKNCKLIVRNNLAYLKTIVDIKKGEEILTTYHFKP